MISKRLRETFAAALRRMLRPVVRQLIAYGITYPTVAEMLKELYVEVAEADFALPFKRQTDSRLALLTGVNRKEVKQLRGRKGGEAVPEVEDTIVTHVIGRWMAGPPYASPDGVPRPLQYESEDPQAPTFYRLVSDLSSDIPVRSVLDELIRVGAAELRADGTVVLHVQANVPAADTEAKLALLGSDPGELFTTIMHNVEHPEQPWVQRKVVYDNIGSEALPQLQEEARRLGQEMIRRANALLASYDRDRNRAAPGGRRMRVAIGTYYFEEPVEKDGEKPSVPPRGIRPPGRIRRRS